MLLGISTSTSHLAFISHHKLLLVHDLLRLHVEHNPREFDDLILPGFVTIPSRGDLQRKERRTSEINQRDTMKLGHPQAWDHGKPVTPSPSTMASGMMQRVLSKTNFMNRLLEIICSEGTMANPNVPTHTGSLTGREARGEDAAEGHNRAPHKEISIRVGTGKSSGEGGCARAFQHGLRFAPGIERPRGSRTWLTIVRGRDTRGPRELWKKLADFQTGSFSESFFKPRPPLSASPRCTAPPPLSESKSRLLTRQRQSEQHRKHRKHKKHGVRTAM